MMNALAIGLVLTSLVTASIWSPSSPPHHDHEHHREVIVKEGHRVVVVEYDKEASGSTKVLISPHDVSDDSKDGSNEAKQKPGDGVFSGPRELVCDAYGKCKHKFASAFGKTKDKMEEIEEHAKEAVSEAIGRSSHGLGEAKHAVGESLGKAKDGVAHGVDKTKGGVAHGVEKAKKAAGDVAETVKEGAEKVKNLDVVDSAKTLGGDIGSNVTDEVGIVKDIKENVQKAGEKSLGEILRKLKEVGSDVVWYFVSGDKIDAVVGLIHMLGFSTAYGMCVWVTFISSYVLGRYLPKHQFGMVQSRMYPVYFKAMAYCVSAALLGHLVSQKDGVLTGLKRFPGLSLLSALVMVLVNMTFLEPRATKTMYERMKIEKEEGRGVAGPTRDGIVAPTTEGPADYGGGTVVRPVGVADYGGATVVRPAANVVVSERPDVLRLNERLRRLNGYSSALNVLTLAALMWHMAYMGRRLHATR